MKNILIAIFLLSFLINIPLIAAEESEKICFKTREIKSIQFKKKFLVFELNNKEKFNVYCKGKFSLTFQSPIIYEPQKMGFKICYNDVLKLKQSTCFIDKIVPVEKKEMFQKEKP